jgi:predicted dehydrogenase
MNNPPTVTRRQFVKTTSNALTLGAALSAFPSLSVRGANEKLRLGFIGVGGRGSYHVKEFSEMDDVSIVAAADPAQAKLDKVKAAFPNAKVFQDFHALLDLKDVDAVVIATADHWHAIPTILACQGGKDVYVEKPLGHNIREGRAMVQAARKYNRVVQLGTQQRSGPHWIEAVERIRSGDLGKVSLVRTWNCWDLKSIHADMGNPPDCEPPPGLNYDLWLGPAPKRPFNVRRFHGSWRWFFDYGTGDLGNDGVHRLDIARWGLETGVAAGGGKLPLLPQKVSALGGKYYFDDDQEWPDTLMAVYDYGDCVLYYEMRIWTPYPLEGEAEGAAVFGDKGYIVIGNGRWRAFDGRGKQVADQQGGYNDLGHVKNFLECIKTRRKPAADLETIGHPSSLLCHLGNASWRAGRTLRFDPATYTFAGDEAANRYLTRPEYRKPWVLPRIAEL